LDNEPADRLSPERRRGTCAGKKNRQTGHLLKEPWSPGIVQDSGIWRCSATRNGRIEGPPERPFGGPKEGAPQHAQLPLLSRIRTHEYRPKPAGHWRSLFPRSSRRAAHPPGTALLPCKPASA